MITNVLRKIIINYFNLFMNLSVIVECIITFEDTLKKEMMFILILFNYTLGKENGKITRGCFNFYTEIKF